MRFFHIAVAASLTFAASQAFAVNPYFSTGEGAIKGYDPVAYFAENKAVKGDAKFSHTWQGAEWHFSSAANMMAFKADPEKYAPQYGGYCAFGVSEGYAVQVDPKAFTVNGGKLYLNYNPAVSVKWNERRDIRIDQANKNWPKVKLAEKMAE